MGKCGAKNRALHLTNLTSLSEPHMKLTQKQQPAKTWLFQHVLGKSHNEMASAVALRKSQQKPLFGSLLQDVCENDELPQAILVSLTLTVYGSTLLRVLDGVSVPHPCISSFRNIESSPRSGDIFFSDSMLNSSLT